MLRLWSVAALVAAAEAKTYMKETFNDAAWEKRWPVPSSWKSASELGTWTQTPGEWYGDAEDKGVKTGPDARFFGMSAKLDEPFDNKGKDLVISYTVKHEQKIDCGGAYIKLLPDMDQDSFGGDTTYAVMFGPDICGVSTRKTHVIFHYPPKEDNLLINKDVKTMTDQLSHLYTLHLKPDNTYEVFIDKESVRSGNLKEDWDFLEPEEVDDDAISKPEDWIDDKMMADPAETKPEGWDDIPAEVADPSAEMPDDWDEDEDGEWEAPLIPNPDYKGPWRPTMIENPDYKGSWVQPKKANPDFVDDPELHYRCAPCTHVGFELWQVKAGTMFDDILVTDSLDEAWAFADETFFKKQDKEKEMFDEAEKVRKEEEDVARKAAEEAASAGAEDMEDDYADMAGTDEL